MRTFTGYVPSPSDDRDQEVHEGDIKSFTPGSYPSKFNVYEDKSELAAHLPFTSHVYNQGYINSCVCNAFASAYACALQPRPGQDTPFKPSRLFLYYVGRLAYKKRDEALVRREGKSAWLASLTAHPPTGVMDVDEGTAMRDVLDVLSALGYCGETEIWDVMRTLDESGLWPYIEASPDDGPDFKHDWTAWMRNYNAASEYESKDDKWPIFPKGALCSLAPYAKCFANAIHHHTLRYAHPSPVDDANCWKACIQGGYPVVSAMNVYEHFESTATQRPYIAELPAEGEKFRYAHVMVAVGWDDNIVHGGAFRVQNSWGEQWGEHRFFWMGFDWLNSRKVYQKDAWVLLDTPDS